MKNPTMTACRPRDHLVDFAKRYPNAWKQAAGLINDKGQNGFPDWPAWCFLPIAGSYAVISAELGVNEISLPFIGDVAKHAALLAWRVTQGIYRFDPAVYEAVRDTPVSGDIPHEVLYRLPEWCIYIETPDMMFSGEQMHGAFVHLEHDVNTGLAELRLLLDLDTKLVPTPLHLGAWTLQESISRMASEAGRQAVSRGFDPVTNAEVNELKRVVEPILSLVLYVCTQASEIGDAGRKPEHPQPTKTKRGVQYFAPDKPTTWEVGVRLGAALRRAFQAQETHAEGSNAGPRPHIRRAHWHGFRSGPRLKPDGSEIPATMRAFDLKWLPPIPVNLSDEDLPAVVRVVK